MTEVTLTRRQDRTLTVIAYVILLGVASAGVATAPSPAARWGIGLLCLAFGLVLTRLPTGSTERERPTHFYLLVQTAIVAAAMALHPDWTLFALLFCLLNAQAMVLLPARRGVLWIALFLLVVAVVGLVY